jgi:hypothetical protein
MKRKICISTGPIGTYSFHRYQTRSRGLDQPETGLSVIKEEEDPDTEISGSWSAGIPRCENHKVGPRTDVWAEENAMSLLSMDGRSHGQVGPKAAMGYFSYFGLF